MKGTFIFFQKGIIEIGIKGQDRRNQKKFSSVLDLHFPFFVLF